MHLFENVINLFTNHTWWRKKKNNVYVLLCTFFSQGGKITVGGSTIESEGNYVQPTIVEISPTAAVVKEELFGPVLYVMKFKVVSLIESSVIDGFYEYILRFKLATFCLRKCRVLMKQLI